MIAVLFDRQRQRVRAALISKLRDCGSDFGDFAGDDASYCLDAPEAIPAGSTRWASAPGFGQAVPVVLDRAPIT